MTRTTTSLAMIAAAALLSGCAVLNKKTKATSRNACDRLVSAAISA
jgi:hypothetical protein